MADKIFKSHNSQLRILRSRGLEVKSSAKKILEAENYYNIINGYKDLFLDKTATTETYKNGAAFSEIFALYEFDRELRFIFLKRLLKIENQIKSVIAYKFSERYGHDNYLKLDNFDPHNNDSKKLHNIMSVISTFQRSISDQSGKHNAVTHYVTEYGYVPLWVLVNVLTFGNISRFYGVLKLQDRQAVAREFGLQENVFKSYLKLMSMFRNICAHDERFYNTKLGNLEIVSGPIHARLAIPLRNGNGKPIYGKNDLFALLICLKEFLPKRTRGEFAETIKQIEKEIDRLKNNIHTINIVDILVMMGFPTNWKTL
ncbi:Abi family protein [Anaeromusa acidaminophila]|uniref:Abi family protein n=1 Tax=Anaeromusa acidaminophila TaxID=81464 RepID=UPI00036C10E3|nr:Abi family protein [Anaeromusa acidaminophila]